MKEAAVYVDVVGGDPGGGDPGAGAVKGGFAGAAAGFSPAVRGFGRPSLICRRRSRSIVNRGTPTYSIRSSMITAGPNRILCFDIRSRC